MNPLLRWGVVLAACASCSSTSSPDAAPPDLLPPTLIDDLRDRPTPLVVHAACDALVAGSRRNHAALNGYVAQLGILGREAYNLDPTTPAYVTELLAGPLDPASPLGGNFWSMPYANIRLAQALVAATAHLSGLSDAEKAAIRGFAQTLWAIDLLEVIVTHDTNGGMVEAEAEIVDKAVVYAEIRRLLDAALPDLDAGGSTFPFQVPGHAGFDNPSTFRKVNRAMAARVAAYVEDYPAVLAALQTSFIDDSSAVIDLDVGAYYDYSDLQNELGSSQIFAHPSLELEVEKNGSNLDARYTRKVEPATPGAALGLNSSLRFKAYTPTSKLPLIRNEELILLKSEALYFTGKVPEAMTELNLVRQQAGGLSALVGQPSMLSYGDYLLYERRYSLLFEGGHRWIDMRRFGRELTLDKPDHRRNVRYPIPQSECSQRQGEPRCALGSN